MKKILFFILTFTFASSGYSQVKYERERSIPQNQVPEAALLFVKELNFNSRVKWYKETSIEKISYEAKTRFNGKRHSVEFARDGSFEDIEIEIRQAEIPSPALKAILEQLNASYQKYKIEKIQVQYSGPPKEVIAFFNNQQPHPDIITRYEIVISTRVQDTYSMFELLFSEQGEILKTSRIILKNTDNIIY